MKDFQYLRVTSPGRAWPPRPDRETLKYVDRFTAAAADSQAEATVDPAGRLIDLRLDRELLRQPTWAVAEAVVAAVTQAQDAAATSASQRLAELFNPDRVADDIAEADLAAERRLAELRLIVADLARHQRRP